MFRVLVGRERRTRGRSSGDHVGLVCSWNGGSEAERRMHRWRKSAGLVRLFSGLLLV